VNYEDYAASQMEVELYRTVAAKRAEICEALAVGSPKNYDEYKYWTGYIAALKDMNDLIVTVRKKLNTK
jgi:hypothetical protein